jgi:hypothetical protein
MIYTIYWQLTRQHGGFSVYEVRQYTYMGGGGAQRRILVWYFNNVEVTAES